MATTSNPSRTPRLALLHALQAVEAAFDRAFGPGGNPWRHLGALSFFLFWVIAVTGIYVYALFDTSVTGAYRSVEHLAREQWYLGGVMRSLHRYASDAFVVTMLLHLLKEYLGGHYYNFRWFSWLTGVPLLWLAYASGIGGYWLVWDQLAQFSIIATAEWLDFFPLFGEPLMRNFLAPRSVDDRFFSLLIFLHIGIPLLLLLGMWIHIQRISRPVTIPPRVLGWGTLITLIAVSVARPAVSHEPADLSLVPAVVQPDWYYMFVHPLMYRLSPGQLWAFAGGSTLLIAALPLLPHPKPQPVARVSLANCNGCGRCFADCPYAAVILQPRNDGRPLARQATVLPDLCAGCGICAGACPSSTPFRSGERLVTGIDMPRQPIGLVRAELERALSRMQGTGRIVVFGCDEAADVKALAGTDTAAISLICAGMLPPSFVEYAVRGGAAGVLITGCRDGDCLYRLGNRWVEDRIRGERQPHLRINVPRERVRIAWADRQDLAGLKRELEAFRTSLAALSEATAGQARPRPKRMGGHG
ncbi:MAG: hydrogenase iron-sulfur subunit [Betaproteobacteria bacterium]|nr:hydrogenase iron-sulfur subunit [Betaproteobacteria bacterium]